MDQEIGNALAHHLERALNRAFPQERESAGGRQARTRGLVALQMLADAEGRRSEGLSDEDLVKIIGPEERAVVGRLSAADTRLIVVTGGRCTLSHDRLADVVLLFVRNEAARGNLLLDQALLDVQWTIGQKLALHQRDANDESALSLTAGQRALIEGNENTLLFDEGAALLRSLFPGVSTRGE